MGELKLFSAASGVILAPDLWEKRLPAKFASACPRLVETREGLAWSAGGKLAASTAPAVKVSAPTASRDDTAWLATAEGRRWIQDGDDVNGEVLYSTDLVWDLVQASEDEKFILACTRAYNDWLAELCGADPQRFVGVAKLPTTGAKAAAAELARAIDELKLKGAMLDAWPAGKESPPALGECEAFWEAAAAHRAPISLYRPLNGEREPDLGIAGGATPEFYQDMTTIIYANIPDKHPNIRFVSVAANAGWAPQAFEALTESYMRTAALRKVNLANPDLYPSDYLRRYFYYVTQNDRTALLNSGYFGAAHLMFASLAFMSDEASWPNTREMFERLTGGMSAAFRAQLASGVVSRLYGLDRATPFAAEEINDYDRYALI